MPDTEKQELKHKFNPNGFVKLTEMILEGLMMKKRVALFDSYEEAKNDVLREIMNKASSDTEADYIFEAFHIFEATTYLERWFNEMK